MSSNDEPSNGDLSKFQEWVDNNSTVRPIAQNIANLSPGTGDGKSVSSGTVFDTVKAAFGGVSVALDGVLSAYNGQPVVSNSRLVGPNAQQALQADSLVQQARASGNAQMIQNALAVSPATGCAMILTLAIKASGYNPAAPGAAGNLAGFYSYVHQVLLCPAFSALLDDQQSPNMSGDWNSVVNQIVGYYVGIDTNDLNYIRSGLYSLAQAASSSPSTNQTQNLFVQNTLNAGSQLVVYMYQSFVRMVTTVQSGGKHSPDTVTNNASLTIYRVVLQFNTAYWPAYAPVINSQTSASLDDWLNNTTTPQGPVPVQWNF